MSGTTQPPRPLVLTDDELMALAAVSGRAWWTGLRSVDVASEVDMISASGRGLRSLATRSLIAEDGAPDESLALALTCLGTRPWATVVAVDERDHVVPDAPMLVVFRGENTTVACRSDVSGTHLLHELDPDHAVELVTEQLTVTEGVEVAAAFWSPDLAPRGGLRRRGSECRRMSPEGEDIGLVGRTDEHDLVAHAVRSSWER